PGLVSDHAPVADGEELGRAPRVVDREALDDSLDVRRVAGVLDVEEDRVARGRTESFGSRRRNTGDAYRLGIDARQRQLRLTAGRRDKLDGRRRLDRRGRDRGNFDAGGGGGRFPSAATTGSSGGRSFHARIIRDTPGLLTKNTPGACP